MGGQRVILSDIEDIECYCMVSGDAVMIAAIGEWVISLVIG